jgi:hypothetical protein
MLVAVKASGCIVLYIFVIDRAVQDNSGLPQFDKEERIVLQ